MSAFDQLASKLAGQKGVSDPRALAAVIGRRKYSGSVMAKAAAQGRPAASVAKQQPKGY